MHTGDVGDTGVCGAGKGFCIVSLACLGIDRDRILLRLPLVVWVFYLENKESRITIFSLDGGLYF